MQCSTLCSIFVIVVVISSDCPCLFVTTVWSSITTAKHRTWHLCCHTTTPPGGTWPAGGASTLDQLQNGDWCSRHIRWKCGWTQRRTALTFLPSILDGIQVRRVWLSGRFPYNDLMMSAMYMLNKGIMRWGQRLQFRSRGNLGVVHLRLPQLIPVCGHLVTNLAAICTQTARAPAVQLFR